MRWDTCAAACADTSPSSSHQQCQRPCEVRTTMLGGRRKLSGWQVSASAHTTLVTAPWSDMVRWSDVNTATGTYTSSSCRMEMYLAMYAFSSGQLRHI